MQTFLPLPSFGDSLQCLDTKRLGKQRVETKQLLITLGISVGPHAGNTASRWRNHPAAKMWRGYEKALIVYGIISCRVWRWRGYRDSLLDQFNAALSKVEEFVLPDWVGEQEFHMSHRSNLIRKDAVHYGQFNWGVQPDLPYVWPAGRSLRILSGTGQA